MSPPACLGRNRHVRRGCAWGIYLVRAHCGSGIGVRCDHFKRLPSPAGPRPGLPGPCPFRWSAQALELALRWCLAPSTQGREHHDVRVARGKVGVVGGAHAAVDVARAVDADGGNQTGQRGARGDGVHQVDAESRSNATNSPVCASMAITIIGLSGHSGRGNRAATIARRCPAPGSSMESLSSPNAPIARCSSAAEVAAAPMALIRSNTVPIGKDGGCSRICPTGRTGGDRTEANSSAGGMPLRPVLPRWHQPRCRSPNRRPRHIETSFGQACDDADLPRISSSATAAENQSKVVNHLPTISARRPSCGSK